MSMHRASSFRGAVVCSELCDEQMPAAPRGVWEHPGSRGARKTGRSLCRGAIGALLVASATLTAADAGHAAAKLRGVHVDLTALSKTSAQMRLKLKALTQRQDEALSKAEELLSAPLGDDTGANAKAPPTPDFLKPGHAALDFADVKSTKLVSSKLKQRESARMQRGEDERWNRERHGPGSRLQDVDKRELAQERRDRTSERQGAGLGSEKRALEEAAAFARLTAGARDPRAAAKKRLAQKYAHESYERASNEGMIWKEINQMRHQSEDQTVRVDTSDGLNGEVRELANLPAPKAAQVLAKMSQTDGSAALGALKSIDPEQVKRILEALGEQSAPHNNDEGKVDADGGPGPQGKTDSGDNRTSSQAAPPPEFDIHTVDSFDPGESLSFAGGNDGGTFSLSYADNSVMTGYVCKDIVQLGHYYAMTRFGCALDCNDPSFNGVDGILGVLQNQPARCLCWVAYKTAKFACTHIFLNPYSTHVRIVNILPEMLV